MRYYVDCEFNGSGGQLISIGLVTQSGDRSFYRVLPMHELPQPWIRENVFPVLGQSAVPRAQASAELAEWLDEDRETATFVSDWPEDIVHLLDLTLSAPLERRGPASYRTLVLDLPGFAASAVSAVPHCAVHDAEALRAFCEQGLADGVQGALTARDFNFLRAT